MTRRFLAVALTLALTLVAVGHASTLAGISQPVSIAAELQVDPSPMSVDERVAQVIDIGANGCEGHRHASSGVCSFDAIPAQQAAQVVLPRVGGTTGLSSDERLERPAPNQLLRPPIFLV